MSSGSHASGSHPQPGLSAFGLVESDWRNIHKGQISRSRLLSAPAIASGASGAAT